MTIDDFLGRLSNVQRSGTGWLGKCPAHDDRQNSLSVAEGREGRIVIRDFAGCDARKITDAMGLSLRDLFGSNGNGHRPGPARPKPPGPLPAKPAPRPIPETKAATATMTRTAITVEDLAQDKRVPVDFLLGLGLREEGGAVVIPYRDASGNVVAEKKRTALKAKDGSFWPRGVPLRVYGEDRLADAREHGELVLVEGESDAWTCWFHGIPALGVPGASAWRTIETAHVEGIGRLFVVQEPDQGGQNFIEGVRSRLAEIGWTGEARILRMPDAIKDVACLHKAAPERFKEKFAAAMKNAKPLEAQAADTGPGRDAVTVRACDVTPEPISWLWPGRIAAGKVSLLVGDPGLGKSLVTVAMAACVSRGGRWPVDREPAPLGDVVLLSAEDDPADTIRPRLEAAGSDLSRVHILTAIRDVTKDGDTFTRGFSLLRDVDALDGLLGRLTDCKLVVVDPVSAYLDGTDSHNNAEVRAALVPLAELAARRRVAIVGVSHLNKGGQQSALYRVTGSLAFVAAARSVLAVTRDPEDKARRLVLPIKNNLGPDSGGLAYRVDAPEGVPVAAWEDEPVLLNADEVLAPQVVGEERRERAEAVDWLRDALADGPVAAKDIQRLSKDAGLAWATVRRAKDALSIKPEKGAFSGGWTWALPPKMLTFSQDAQPKRVSTFGTSEHLGGPEPSPDGEEADAPELDLDAPLPRGGMPQ